MRHRDLMKVLAGPADSITSNEPPERAAFSSDKEMEVCCSILDRLIRNSRPKGQGGCHAEPLPMPNAALPMLF